MAQYEARLRDLLLVKGSVEPRELLKKFKDLIRSSENGKAEFHKYAPCIVTAAEQRLLSALG